MKRLSAIRPLGQRIWLDNLSRELLQTGALECLVRDDGIAGVTSNPAIFEKFIRQCIRVTRPISPLEGGAETVGRRAL